MSSSGMMREMTPLLPWRPAILSPGCSLRFTATKTLTIFITPGGSSSPRCSFSTLSSKRFWMRVVAASYCRSEEHTSELQSLMRISYAVFCLKKKNNNKELHHHLYYFTERLYTLHNNQPS